MSRWRAAPPSTGLMDWEQSNTKPEGGLTNSPHLPLPRPQHHSSPLSLASYRLLGPNNNDAYSSRRPSIHGQSYDKPLSPLANTPTSRTFPHHFQHHFPPPPPQRQATLPIELYRQIVQYVTSQRDLCALARVSRAFQLEAERVLYHSLQLRHHIKTLWRCESLATQPRLAAYVRRLSIIIDQYTPLESIARALASCQNLRHLALRGAPWSDYSKVLDSVGSMEIREFTCHARGEAGVVRFLERQKYLEEIDFEAHAFDLDNLSSNAARELKVFTGWLTTAATIVPGRPVRLLNLTSDMTNDATVRAVQKLSEVNGEVEALDIRMGVLRNPISWAILESVFISMRGLRFLGVISLDCARHPSFPFYIMGLPRLQTLVFGTGTDDFEKYDEQLQLELCHRLGQSCESLTQVIVSLAVWKNDWIWMRNPSNSRSSPTPLKYQPTHYPAHLESKKSNRFQNRTPSHSRSNSAQSLQALQGPGFGFGTPQQLPHQQAQQQQYPNSYQHELYRQAQAAWPRSVDWQASWTTRGQDWWGMVSPEPINLDELARLHVSQ